jgi:hypothetical protein
VITGESDREMHFVIYCTVLENRYYEITARNVESAIRILRNKMNGRAFKIDKVEKVSSNNNTLKGSTYDQDRFNV